MKKKAQGILFLIIVVLAVVGVGIYFFIKYQTCEYMQVMHTYKNDSTDNANYQHCMDGILRYSRDGVALLTEEGKEIWNHPGQMNNPIIETCGNSLAVGDKGGTSIYVFQKKGLKGEIHTTRPIEKMAVSSQGIVSAILRDEETPLVMCYDAKGNILVEHKASVKNMGYPLDVAISEDGNTLLVSYLYMQQNKIVTKVVYYYFGEGAKDKGDYEVKQKEFPNTLIPTTAFLDKDISLLVSQDTVLLYKGLEKPEEFSEIKFKKEIQSVAYNKETIAIVFKNDGMEGYTLCTYNTKGKQLASVGFEKEYSHIKVEDGQVMMYDGQLCSIYMKNGTKKYEGKMDDKIMEIFPIAGLNKYMVINASGFQEVKLVR